MGKLDKLSIFISLALRHKPEAANITLDAYGWADVDELLAGVRATGRDIDRVNPFFLIVKEFRSNASSIQTVPRPHCM